MEKRTRDFLIEVFRPVYLLLSFVLRFVYKLLFGWLEIWSQKKADASLLYDIRVNLHFLFPMGSVVRERWYRVLPFDYASVRVNYGNVCYCFTRGREELNLSLSPRHAPREIYELAVAIAALDSTDVTEQKPTSHLSDVGDVLRPRLDTLNDAFSESHYPDFRTKLSSRKKALRVLAKQAEWELNRRLYH
jgi:hypothetical protein